MSESIDNQSELKELCKEVLYWFDSGRLAADLLRSGEYNDSLESFHESAEKAISSGLGALGYQLRAYLYQIGGDSPYFDIEQSHEDEFKSFKLGNVGAGWAYLMSKEQNFSDLQHAILQFYIIYSKERNLNLFDYMGHVKEAYELEYNALGEDRVKSVSDKILELRKHFSSNEIDLKYSNDL